MKRNKGKAYKAKKKLIKTENISSVPMSPEALHAEAVGRTKSFLQGMKALGFRAIVGAVSEHQMVQIGSLLAHEALGMAEYIKASVTNGIQKGESFDAFVQSLENSPIELISRYRKALGRTL